MTAIQELLSTALLGTRGAPLKVSDFPDDIASALPADESTAETKLLDATAIVTLYSRAGVVPRRDIAAPQSSASDRLSECSSRAADILAQIIEAEFQPLLLEWLELAATTSRRPPHRLLPKLLEVAAARKSFRPAVVGVIDERGRWLMQFHSQWQFANASSDIPDEAWHIGNREQRAEVLRIKRARDPAKARELVAQTWKDDAADERAEWIGYFLDGLSEEDEEFLEGCLDDRSSRVREAAADLLARLPNSRFVSRMIQRASAHVRFAPGSAGGLLKLKRSSKASLEVTLPESFDKAMQRDGMTEKPGESLGQKQWWLQQIIGSVPLDFWTKTFDVSAETLVAAAPADFAKVFYRGWLRALSRRPVVEWVSPLFSASGSEAVVAPAVLKAIPLSQRETVLKAILTGSEKKFQDLQQILEAWRPLDEPISKRILRGYDLRTILICDAQFYLHPNTLSLFELQIEKNAELPELKKRMDQALSVIAIRRNLHKEFTQ